MVEYNIRICADPADILGNFAPDEQAQILTHFRDADTFAAWVLDGIVDYLAGDGYAYELDAQLWGVQERLDAENRGETIYW